MEKGGELSFPDSVKALFRGDLGQPYGGFPEQLSKIILKGELPSVENPPQGCRFNTRCDHARDICRAREPALLADRNNPDHMIACHFPGIQ